MIKLIWIRVKRGSKANEHNTSDMTYKRFKLERTHVKYHDHIDITHINIV